MSNDIDKARAELDRQAAVLTALKADLLETIQEALKNAIDYGEEDVMGNYTSRRPKAYNVVLTGGELLVEWTDGVHGTEAFVVQVTRA